MYVHMYVIATGGTAKNARGGGGPGTWAELGGMQATTELRE